MATDKRALTVIVNPTAVAGRGSDPSDSRRQEATRVLWQRKLPQTLARVACLEETATALLEGRLEPDLRARASRAAHQLAGSIGSFGFVEASGRARAVEQRLRGDAPLEDPAVLELCQDVEAVRAELDPDEGPAASVAGDAEDAHDQLAVVTADDAWAEQLRAEAGVRGLRMWRATDAALRDTTRPRPDAVLIDLADGSVDPGSLLQAVSSCAPAPMVALCASDAFVDRAALGHAGVHRVLSADTTAREAVDAVSDALASTQLRGVTAVVWFDDPVDGDAVALGLRELGMEVVAANGPADAWAVVTDQRPGLVVASAAPREVADLCVVVRSDARWARLPLIASARAWSWRRAIDMSRSR
jgi:DNA-binding response OmpR family regulator